MDGSALTAVYLCSVVLGIGQNLAEAVNEVIGWQWVAVLVVAMAVIAAWPRIARRLKRRR